MKRLICLMLALLLLCSLCSCHYSESGDILEPVEFFYPRKSDDFIYGSEEGVLAAEVREAAGHAGDLNYLLSLYLRGPQNSSLRSFFPDGCTLEEVRSGGNTLCIVLSSEFTQLEGMALTLACAGLARTCFSMTGAQRIRIDAASDEKTFTITLDADSLLLADYSAFEIQPTEGNP